MPCLNGDAAATLEAAALQDEAAGPGGHALDESVHALTAALFGLISSL